jgi:hypothetical protein
MHEMIGQAMATDFERDRVAAASATRAALSLEPTKAQSARARFSQVVIRLARRRDARATAERLARRADAPFGG